MTPPDVLKIALREKDPTAMVQGDFSDDPEMFRAIYGFESQKTGDINETVKTNIKMLSHQLRALPLRNGSAKDVVSLMLQSLGH